MWSKSTIRKATVNPRWMEIQLLNLDNWTLNSQFKPKRMDKSHNSVSRLKDSISEDENRPWTKPVTIRLISISLWYFLRLLLRLIQKLRFFELAIFLRVI